MSVTTETEVGRKLRPKTALLAVVVTAILLSSSFLVIWSFLPDENSLGPKFFVGVQFGYGGVDDCKALVDKVKNYTNLFVISSSDVTRDEADLNEVCDYIYNAGLYFIVYFQTIATSYKYNTQNWTILAKETYGNQFLGEYLLDEIGGKQLDLGFPRIHSANNYMEATNEFIELVKTHTAHFTHSGGEEFTADYGLYWFDYKAGYDTVLAEFGWNHSRQLHIALCRGAAEVQNKDWGVMITWTYNHPPYLESGDELYDDLLLAYHNGAKYAVVFNHDENNAYSGYGIMTEEHFEALENFWNYKNDNQKKQSSLTGDVAFVLPQDYGFGFRGPDDRVWGLWEIDQYSSEIWNDVNDLLDEYGTRLDIVYYDTEFNDKIEECYSEVFTWESETADSFPVQNLNSSLGYETIQAAINSGYTLDGHVIYVNAGTYYENLVVNKSVTLIGEDRKTTIIDGGNGGTAVYLRTSANITGFTLRNGDYPSLEGDQFTSILAAGIYLDASNCSIVGNDITDNSYGIYLRSSGNNTLSDNNIANNSINLMIEGDSLSHFINNIDTSNTINGKKVHYFVNEKNLVIDSSFSDIGFLALVNCTNIVAQNLNISNNRQGILLVSTTNSSIMENHITNNYYGIQLEECTEINITGNNINNNNLGLRHYGSSYSTISENNIENNRATGIYLQWSNNNSVNNNSIIKNGVGIQIGSIESYGDVANSDNQIVGNNVTENSCGIKIEGLESGNIFYHNNLINNTRQVQYDYIGGPDDEPTIKMWDNGVEGNYWSDYADKDTNHDGIGDTEYLIETLTPHTTVHENGSITITRINITDRYPLSGMFSSFTQSGQTFNVISNSTIENFQYHESDNTIDLQVNTESFGFCRIAIPHTAMNINSISVVINEGQVSVLNPNYQLYDDGNQRWIYFAYPEGTQEIQITAGPP